MSSLTGLLAALAAALAYGIASVLQAVGSRRLATGAVDVAMLVRLVRSLPYLAGVALDGVGFAAGVVALRSLPLFLVQSAVAASVGVTAVAAWRFLGTPLGRREVVSLGVLAGGLVLLAVSAQAESGRPLPAVGAWAVLLAAAPVGGLVAAAGRWRPAAGATGLAVAAGLGFAGVGIAARALQVPHPWWHVLASPLLWALVAHGLIGMAAYAAALQRGAVTVVAAVTFAVETVVPSVVGVAVLGDRTRPGFAAVAVAGLVATVAAAAALARSAEPDAHASTAPPS